MQVIVRFGEGGAGALCDHGAEEGVGGKGAGLEEELVVHGAEEADVPYFLRSVVGFEVEWFAGGAYLKGGT